ncbi:ATP synthase F(0) complex subunit g, mitochondrial-like [Brevipalpus obovatus]|uniref:ATP synthase F(0) complex subunit g, mitochondrial-like n=1 Tax=Brevipalpus obovatus TaxID=246614 RepID=UPI003D9FAFFF
MSRLVKAAVPWARSQFAQKYPKFKEYAKVELVPPTPAELPEAFRHGGRLLRGLKTGAWRDVTVKEALVNTVITMEVMCWFFLGEIVGKMKIIGYNI